MSQAQRNILTVGLLLAILALILWIRTDADESIAPQGSSFASHLESHGIQPVRPFRDGKSPEGTLQRFDLEPGDIERVSPRRTTAYRRRADVFAGDPELSFEWRDAGVNGRFVDSVEWTQDGTVNLPDFLGVPGVGLAVKGSGKIRIETEIRGVQKAVLLEGNLLEHFEQEAVRRTLAEDEGLTVVVEVWRADEIKINLEVERASEGKLDLNGLESRLKAEATYQDGQGQNLVARDRIFAFRPVWVFAGRERDLTEVEATQVATSLETADVDARARRGLVIAYPRLAQVGLLIEFSRIKWSELRLNDEVAELGVELEIEREERLAAGMAQRDAEHELAAVTARVREVENESARLRSDFDRVSMENAHFRELTALGDPEVADLRKVLEVRDAENASLQFSIDYLLADEAVRASVQRRHEALEKAMGPRLQRLRSEVDPRLTLESWIENETDLESKIWELDDALRDEYEGWRRELRDYERASDLLRRRRR